MNQNIKFYLTIACAIILIVISFLAGKGCTKCPEPPKVIGSTSHTWTDIEVKPNPPLQVETKGKVLYKTKTVYVPVPSYVSDSTLYMRIMNGDSATFDSVKISELNQYYLARPDTYGYNTISNGDTLDIKHEMPMNLFFIDWRQKPDSTIRFYKIDSIKYEVKKHWVIGGGINAGLNFDGRVSAGPSLFFGYIFDEW